MAADQRLNILFNAVALAFHGFPRYTGDRRASLIKNKKATGRAHDKAGLEAPEEK